MVLMQVFFWFSIALLAFASFAYIALPAFVGNDAVNGVFDGPFKKSSLALSILLMVGSVGLYALVGNSSKIISAEQVKMDSKYSAIIEQIETHLAKNPEDAEGWQVLAPAYLSLNMPEKAFEAFANAIKFGNSNGENWLGLGKSNLLVNRGVFGPMTKVAFTKAYEKLPDSIETVYFYATMLQNEQEFEQARAVLTDYLADQELTDEQAEPLNQILDLLEKSEKNK